MLPVSLRYLIFSRTQLRFRFDLDKFTSEAMRLTLHRGLQSAFRGRESVTEAVRKIIEAVRLFVEAVRVLLGAVRVIVEG